MPTSPDTDAAYLAGILDGEGSIMLTRRSSKHRFRYPAVTVASNTKEIVEWLRETFGGRVAIKQPRKKQPNIGYEWRIHGNFACAILRTALPYMKEPKKVTRAQLIADEYHSCRVKNGHYTQEQEKRRIDFEDRFYAEG